MTPARCVANDGDVRAELSLCRRLGIDEADRERRLAFLGFSSEDAGRLVELRGLFESIADEVVDQFYNYLKSFEETARYLEDSDLVDKLKTVQRRHFLEFCRGRYDSEYVESRLRVGMAHARINLPPRWYLGAHRLQLAALQSSVIGAFSSQPDKLEAYLAAGSKIVLFDIELAMEAYIFGGFVERSLAEAHELEAQRATDALEERDHAGRRRATDATNARSTQCSISP